MALAAYRHVLRSSRIAFHGTLRQSWVTAMELTRISAGDTRILSAARIEARSRFDSHRTLSPEGLDAKQKIAEAEEIARILRQNIVQGQQTEPTEEGHKYRALRSSRPV